MSLGPTLTTERLILRPPMQADFEAFASMAQEEETMRHIGGVAPRDAAWRMLATMTGAWSLIGYSLFSVLKRDSGEWIGRLGPWRLSDEMGDDFGWGLKASAMGQGYAREGAAAAIDWLFDELGWARVKHCITKDNAASIALAERLGSRLEQQDVPFGGFEDVKIDIYGQSAAEWRARRLT